MPPTLSNPPTTTPVLHGNVPSPVWTRWLQQLRNAAATAGGLVLTAVGSAPNANGASLVLPDLTLQPADATHPGLLTALGQTFGGLKTFAAGLALSSGQEITFGDTTTQNTAAQPASMAAFGSTPNNNGGVFSSGALTLEPADGTHPGGLTTGAQTIGGKKTFAAGLDAGSNAITSVTDPTNAQDASTKNYTNNHGSMIVPFSGSDSVASTSTTWFTPTAGSTATGSTTLAVSSAIIIPFAYTIKALYWRIANAPTGGITLAFNISKSGGAAQNMVTGVTAASGSSSSPSNNTGSAGDYIQVGVAMSAATGGPPGQSEVSLWIQPT